MNYDFPERVSEEWQIGDVILNRYEVRDKFEGGGMGLVYRVYHREWNIELAVKSPRSNFFETAEQVENFEREAETWVNLGLHPHIVSCYYVRRLGGIPRIFAEYVGGGSLADWIRDKRLYEDGDRKTLERVLDVAIQVAWGLHYAHEKGLVHQDVKPGNVLMMLDGTAKVSDFGLARARQVSGELTAVAPRSGHSLLVPGSGFLTPAYASPEQWRGETLTRRSDIWSWAAMVLEMLRHECDWSDGRAIPGVLEEIIAEFGADNRLTAILSQCVALAPNDRASSMTILSEALRQLFKQISGKAYPRAFIINAHFSSEILNNKGVSLLEIGRTEEGFKCLEEALQINPRNLHSKFNALVIKWRMGEISDEDVIETLHKDRDPEKPETLDLLLGHVVNESGIQTNPETVRVTHTDDIFRCMDMSIARHPSSLVLVRVIKHDCDLAVISVSRCGNVVITKLSGETLCSLDLCDADNGQILSGGRFWIADCAVTPDGRLLVYSQNTYGKRNNVVSTHVNVYDLIQRKLTSSKMAHHCDLSCLTVLNCGELLTAGSTDGQIRVWKLPDLGLPVGNILNLSDTTVLAREGAAHPFASGYCDRPDIVAYSASSIPGSSVVAINQSRQIRLWNREPWRTITVLKKFTSNAFFHGVTASSDGQLIASGGRHLHIWHVDGALVRVIENAEDTVDKDIRFSPDGKFLVGHKCFSDVATDSGIMVWDVATGRRVKTIKAGKLFHGTVDAASSGKDLTIIAGDTAGQVRACTLKFEHARAFLSVAQPKSWYQLQVVADVRGEKLAAVRMALNQGDHKIALTLIRELQKSEDALHNSMIQELEIQIVTRGRRVALSGAILEHTIEAPELSGSFHVNDTGTQILWSEDYLAQEREIGGILFDVKSGAEIARGLGSETELPESGGSGIWIDSYRNGYASSVVNCEVGIKNTAWPPSQTYCDDISRDGNHLLMTNATEVIFWNVINGCPDSRLPLDSKYIRTLGRLNRDGTWVMLKIGENMLRRYECGSWQMLSECVCTEGAYIDHISLCENDSKLLTSGSAGVQLWDAALCKLLRTFVLSQEPVIRPKFDDDPLMIVEALDCYPFAFVGCRNGSVLAINCNSGAEEFIVGRISGSVESLAISPDKLRLIVNGSSIFHLFWDYEFDHLK
jgi:serine/threonine protein kinase